MLAKRDIDWSAKWKQLGREEGLEQGSKKQAVALLQRQLGKRFGSLPDWAAQRVELTSVEQIGEWPEAIFDAPSLEALLGQDGRSAS